MTRLLIAAAALLGFACASAPPSASFFIDLEHRWIEALAKHDVAALDRLLDDSFIDSTFRGGVRTKHDILTGPSAGAGYHSIRLDDVVVRPYGGRTVIVTGVNVLEGSTASDVARIRFTDVFVRFGDEWRAVSAQETLER